MDQTKAKISGYLEKKGSLKMMSSWRKYWFVLEGRLLLYYRSKDEYDALSPCKGSISLGPRCSVKPCSSLNCVFQIQTRANTIILRAENRTEQEKWMQAVLTALKQSLGHVTPLAHFRYSSGDIKQQNDQESNRKTVTHNENEEMKIKIRGLETIPESPLRDKRPSKTTKIPKTPTLVKILRRRSSCDSFLTLKKSNKNKQTEEEKVACNAEANKNEECAYAVVDKTKKQLDKNTSEDNVVLKIDLNENSLVAAKNKEENIYEEPEEFVKNSIKRPKSRKSLRFFTLSFKSGRSGERNISLKRRPSFIKRMLYRKNKAQKKVEENVDVEKSEKPAKNLANYENGTENDNGRRLQILEEITFSTNPDDHFKPELPPKLNQNNPSPYHDRPTNNRPVHQSIEPTKSIDEILDELDKEKEEEESKPNVKKMIEKFNENQNEVVLRKKGFKNVTEDNSLGRFSENLNELLEELSKVTNAPIMTPGVTSSLVTTKIADEEWLKLLPKKQRRLSDPDYDVPRPHSSLNFQQVGREDAENIMPATRFFGPVLSYSKTQPLSQASLTDSSFTPDSLEILDTPEKSPMSYSSHNYFKENNNSVAEALIEYRFQKSEKSYLEENEEDSLLKLAQDVFIDSLEHFVEMKTAF